MKRGFGLDLSGYSTGKSALAVAELADGATTVCLLDKSPFSASRKLSSLRSVASREEGDCVEAMIALGYLAVDVPIDLQGLPHQPTSDQLWGETKRPIDYALGAMPPFADRIGAVVSRFLATSKRPKVEAALGVSLFETYPAASLTAVGQSGRGYKGADAGVARRAIEAHLKLETDPLNDDELDAAICALTALGPRVLEGANLEAFVLRRTGHRVASLPKGYRLLESVPTENVKVRREAFDMWITASMSSRG